MPVTTSWLLTAPPATIPVITTPALPPVIGSSVPCNALSYSQEDLLGVVDRSYPADYIDSMKRRPDGGYELFQAVAKVMERISIAIARWYCCSFLMFAQGGEKAIGVVELFRTDTTAGALTYRNGSIVQTASGKEGRCRGYHGGL
jgi:hypothetical protein